MSELFSIRDARKDDLALLDAYANAAGMDDMPGTEGIRVAVNIKDEPVGFCRVHCNAEGVSYVNPIVVYEKWRGHGVGTALIRDAHEQWGELRLISRGDIVGFYEALGFEEMSWHMADLEAASEECDVCPYRSECAPIPMRLA